MGFELKQQRQLLVARCLLPQHQDTNPSFTIYPDQRFHCFGCGSSGDVIDLISTMTHRTISEVLKDLDAGPATAPSKETAPAHLSRPERSTVMTFHPDTTALTIAARMYADILRESEAGAPGRHYLASRGIDPDAPALRGLRLGYCPADGRTGQRFAAAGLTMRSAARAGIVITSPETGAKSERFGSQLVFCELSPDRGTATYMAGRRTDDRYPRFDALPGRKVPLGLSDASIHAGDGPVYITEGIFDWLALTQWKLPAVATLGVNVTARTVKDLAQKLRPRALAIAFDTDSEGIEKGAILAERLFEITRAPIQLVSVPNGCKDIAELAAQYGDHGRDLLLDSTAPAPGDPRG